MTSRWYHIISLAGMSMLLAACPAERFRHEKYDCNSSSFDLQSIVVNDAEVGAEVTVIGYSGERVAMITSITDQSIELDTNTQPIKIDRETGKIRVYRGKRFTILACKVTVFTM